MLNKKELRNDFSQESQRQIVKALTQRQQGKSADGSCIGFQMTVKELGKIVPFSERTVRKEVNLEIALHSQIITVNDRPLTIQAIWSK